MCKNIKFIHLNNINKSIAYNIAHVKLDRTNATITTIPNKTIYEYEQKYHNQNSVLHTAFNFKQL